MGGNLGDAAAQLQCQLSSGAMLGGEVKRKGKFNACPRKKVEFVG